MFRCMNIAIFKINFFIVANFTAQTPLFLLSSYKLAFPVVCLKLSSLPDLALEFSGCTYRTDQIPTPISHRRYPLSLHFYSQVGQIDLLKYLLPFILEYISLSENNI